MTTGITEAGANIRSEQATSLSERAERLFRHLLPSEIGLAIQVLPKIDGKTSITELADPLIDSGDYNVQASAISGLASALKAVDGELARTYGGQLIQKDRPRDPYRVLEGREDELGTAVEDLKAVAARIEFDKEVKAAVRGRKAADVKVQQESPEEFFSSTVRPRATELLKDSLPEPRDQLLAPTGELAAALNFADQTAEEASIDIADINRLDASISSWFGESFFLHATGRTAWHGRVVNERILTQLKSTLAELTAIVKRATINPRDSYAYWVIAAEVNAFIASVERPINIGGWSIKSCFCVLVSLDLLSESDLRIPSVQLRVNELKQDINKYLSFYGFKMDSEKPEVPENLQAPEDVEVLMTEVLAIAKNGGEISFQDVLDAGFMENKIDDNRRKKVRGLKKALAWLESKAVELTGVSLLSVAEGKIMVSQIPCDQITKLENSI